jgi:hypothetical protein
MDYAGPLTASLRQLPALEPLIQEFPRIFQSGVFRIWGTGIEHQSLGNFVLIGASSSKVAASTGNTRLSLMRTGG